MVSVHLVGRRSSLTAGTASTLDSPPILRRPGPVAGWQRLPPRFQTRFESGATHRPAGAISTGGRLPSRRIGCVAWRDHVTPCSPPREQEPTWLRRAKHTDSPGFAYVQGNVRKATLSLWDCLVFKASQLVRTALECASSRLGRHRDPPRWLRTATSGITSVRAAPRGCKPSAPRFPKRGRSSPCSRR